MLRTATVLLLAPLASAAPQWSKDPALDLVLSDGAGSEVQPKLARAADGRVLASWYDSDPSGSPAFGFDVRLQSLDPAGQPQWASGGVLVADRGYSSTQDYGLDVGPDGAAFLAFRDDRFTGDQITAARYDASGNASWGPNGVQLTNTSAFVAAPKIAATSDGQCVVAWSENNVVRAQRLDAAGAPLWGAGLTLPAPAGGAVVLSDLVSDGAGGAVIAWVRQPSGFLGPKHLWVQRLDVNGNSVWAPAGVPLFEGDSLQFGNFPSLVPDGVGGVLCAWYGTGPLQCYAQRVLPNGSLAWQADGLPLSLDASQIRVSPSLAYDAASDTATCAWTELNGLQSMRGISAQRLDAAGNRLWGPNGVSVVPLGSDDVGFARAVAVEAGSALLWFQSPGFGQDVVRAAHLDASGASLHAIASIASTPSSKDDLVAVRGPLGDALCAWHGDAGGDDDVRAKNVRADGGVGQQAGALFRNAGTNAATYTVDVGGLGGALVATVDLSSSTHPLALLFAYLAPSALPFGSQEILVDLLDPAGEILGLPPALGPSAQFSVPIPNNSALCGLLLATQAVHAGGPDPLELTNAQDVYLGL